MAKITNFFEKISNWGVNESLTESQQRSLILLNRIVFLTIILMSFIAILFIYLRFFSNLLFIATYDFLFMLILYFNKIKKVYVSYFIVSLIPILIVSMSVYTKIIGDTTAVEMTIAPMNATLIFSFIILLLIDFKNKKHLLYLIPSVICILFFSEIHAFFGLDIYTYSYGKSTIVVKVTYIAAFIAMIWGVNTLHYVNVFFENKIKILLHLTSEKNEELGIQNQIISDKNQQIIDSIKYAKRIQDAIIGSPNRLTSLLNESFILFLPKDIVSGDFYWFYETPIGEKIIIVADCTGHGVSGAFMTVLGNDLLDSIVKINGIYSPKEILENLDKKLPEVLHKDDAKVQDGMDMSILKINKNHIQFAGAKNPLYYVLNGTKEIHTVKGSKFPIGGSLYGEKIFEETSIEITKDMMLYIFSDGFQDQFGGEPERKFLTKNFRELLFEIHQLPISEQKEELNKRFLHWKNGKNQTDDVLVLGIRL